MTTAQPTGSASPANVNAGLTERPDNLSTMLFVAALFHSIIILGVTFTSGESGGRTDATSVDVVLLTREYEKRPESSDAEYLAQQNLAGSGNTTQDEELRVAYGRGAEDIMPGTEKDGNDDRQQEANTTAAATERLFANNPNAAVMNQRSAAEVEVQRDIRTGLPGTANTIEILAAPDTATVLKGAKPRELVISANTRESRIAAYLDSWKRRVERVGTINFPAEVLDQPYVRDPVLQVSIDASGKLNEVIVLTASGNRQLDMAAVDILKRAAPFDSFPDYLRNDYDALKFSYEWRFGGSRIGRMRVPE